MGKDVCVDEIKLSSKNQDMFKTHITKKALKKYNDKRYWDEFKNNSFAFGNFRITNKKI